MQEFEIIMFKDDAVVDGSRQITTDPRFIEACREYAKNHGYEFSCNEVKK